MLKEDLNTYLARAAQDTENALAAALSVPDPDTATLFEGMRYSALAGGKRIRPCLTLAFAELFGGRREDALPLAVAVEMVHTYSLIHDDLPCMDNDDYRRGRLTNHKVYGEAAAVLAGDALLTMAFGQIAAAPLPAPDVVRAVACLSRAAGAVGMVGGQVMDMRAEKTPATLSEVERLQDRKTGALIRAAAELGCIAAGVTDAAVLENARAYATAVGRAFQIIDDILDVYGNAENMGKKTGQDARDGKITYMSFMNREEAFACAADLTAQAKAALSAYPGSDMLSALADHLLARTK